MSIADTLHSMFGGNKGATATAEAGSLLDQNMIRRIRQHTIAWTVEELAACTVTRSDSDYAGCKAELEISDPSGKVILRGREFRSGQPSFWEPRTGEGNQPRNI